MVALLYKILSLLAVYLNGFLGDIFKFEDLTIEKLLQENGYPLEIHEVTTEDGYILTMHRIPNTRGIPSTNHHIAKPPVFLMHGILLSSIDWLILGPENSMGFILADAGYDVWLGNHRGNTYSKRHTNLDPVENSDEFFDYSFHEIRIYDLTAMIDYILKETTHEKITFYGYSQGFTSFAVMAAMKPEYNDKILLVNAFGPVAKVIGLYTLFSHDKVANLYRLMCFLHESLCRQIFMICGFSIGQLPNKDSLLKILANFPAGISLKQLTHYVQGTQTGEFANYDYGSKKNLEKFGSIRPPIYDLKKITTPVILYYGENDAFVNNDVLLNSVAKDLPNVVKIFLIPYPSCNHLDLIYGKNTSKLTSEALKNTNSYNNN